MLHFCHGVSSVSVPGVLTGTIHALQARRRMAGPSGAMSTLLPLCDAFCDIRMSSAELGKMLEVFEEYMPLEHRQMLQEVRKCPARPLILELAKNGYHQAATLVDHFNAVVRRVLDFRWRHLSYIEQYVLRPSGESVRCPLCRTLRCAPNHISSPKHRIHDKPKFQ